MAFADLHSHILPGIDDGAPDIATSVAMVRGLADLGFDTISATPHQKAGQFLPDAEAIARAHADAGAAFEEAGLEVAIVLAAENMWDDVFYERSERGGIPSYGGGRCFLLEFVPTQLPTSLLEHVFRIKMSGKQPVIAHPERYEALWKNDELLRELAEECPLVVDLGAVAGYHGRRQCKIARAWLKRGIAHAAASDAHSPTDVRAAAEGIRWIEKKLGATALDRLLDDNPRAILAGRHPEG